MRHLLVPTDFSESAGKAIDFAVHTAALIDAEITLLHSFELRDNMYVDYLGLTREFNQDMLADAKKRLEEQAAKLPDSISADTLIAKSSIQESIAETAAAKATDLIVMGTMGAGKIEGKLWGSRTASVIGKTKVPVMAIPHEYSWKPPQRMLLATKTFKKDKAILDYVFKLAQFYKAGVKAAVYSATEDPQSETFRQNQKDLEAYGQFLETNYPESADGIEHLKGSRFEEAVEGFIEAEQMDILTMVTYQNGFWESLFNPSKTKEMSFHTKIPLLAVPASFEG